MLVKLFFVLFCKVLDDIVDSYHLEIVVNIVLGVSVDIYDCSKYDNLTCLIFIKILFLHTAPYIQIGLMI